MKVWIVTVATGYEGEHREIRVSASDQDNAKTIAKRQCPECIGVCGCRLIAS